MKFDTLANGWKLLLFVMMIIQQSYAFTLGVVQVQSFLLRREQQQSLAFIVHDDDTNERVINNNDKLGRRQRRRRVLLQATDDSSDESATIRSFDDDDDDKEEEASSKTNVPAGMNPDRPELPELKGDFDWDAKFGPDDDWIVDNVPGKIVLNEIELATQITALTKLEETWRKEAIQEEFESSKQVGFVEAAEMVNGRFAMFFIVTGLLTEYWTGYSFPQQVEEMLRVLGFIGFET